MRSIFSSPYQKCTESKNIITSIIHEYNHFADKTLTISPISQISLKMKFSETINYIKVNVVISNLPTGQAGSL